MKILILMLSVALRTASAAGPAKTVGVQDAITAAVASNLTAQLAQAESEAARARLLQSAAALLPDVLGTASQARVFRNNLAAQGLTLGPIPPLIGPFNSFDARVQLSQKLFDWSAIRRYQAAGAGKELAKRQEDLAREQVAAATALSYIEAVRAGKSVAAAQADADLARNLLTLAQDQHKHGTATGLDVVRAKTRLSDAEVALLRAQVAQTQAQIKLKRLAGWAMSQPLLLKDDLAPGATELASIEASLAAASAARPEIQVASEQLRLDEDLLGAARGERAPILLGTANVGLSGNKPDSGARVTGGIGAGLSVPLFSGGLITGKVREAEVALKKSSERLSDVRLQVEEDVRLAYETSREAAQEAMSAAQTVDLAQQELRMSQDRYGAGAGDNIEVVTAQTELARARDSYVTALARYQDARVNLAAALGKTQSFSL